MICGEHWLWDLPDILHMISLNKISPRRATVLVVCRGLISVRKCNSIVANLAYKTSRKRLQNNSEYDIMMVRMKGGERYEEIE